MSDRILRNLEGGSAKSLLISRGYLGMDSILVQYMASIHTKPRPRPINRDAPHTRFDGYSPTKQEYNVTLYRTGQPACLSEHPAKTDIVFHGRRRPGKSRRHRTSPQTRVHQHDKKDLLYLRQQNFVEIHGVLKGSIYTLKK